MTRIDSIWFESLAFGVNIIFYWMEIRFIVAKNFSLQVGEIGPVEIELIVSSICFIGAGLGYHVFDFTIGELAP